jgi:hypothetical protein
MKWQGRPQGCELQNKQELAFRSIATKLIKICHGFGFQGNKPVKNMSASDVTESQVQFRSVSGHVLIFAVQRTTTKRMHHIFTSIANTKFFIHLYEEK